MLNVAAVGVYIPLLVLLATVFGSVLAEFLKTGRSFLYVSLYVCVIGWLFTETVGWFVVDVSTNLFIWNLAMIFVGFAPLVFFLFFFRYFFPKRKIPLFLVLFIIPVLNILFALTSRNHSLFITGAGTMEFTYGPWFLVHSIYCYILTSAGAATVAYGYVRKPKFYRGPSTLLIVAVVILIGSNLSFLLGLNTASVNFTLVCACIALIIVHFAIISSDQSLFLRHARGYVFRYLEDYVLVLNNDGMIADSNANAMRWFEIMGVHPESSSLQDILSALEQNGATINNKTEGEDGQDIYLVEDGFSLILNLRMHDITDKKGNINGAVAIFTDVTQNRILIERLEKTAGIDYLTGLANRTAFSGAKKRYESAENLPLGVIICDVDGLKTVNDTLGHKYGDMLIQNVAEVLKKLKPDSYFCARLGGDEFIFLMPKTNPEQAHRFIEQVREALAKLSSLPFVLSVSMGAAIKYGEEDLDEVISLADKRMYMDKKGQAGQGDGSSVLSSPCSTLPQNENV